MATKLLIVESPSKAKSISSYLGDDYCVLSSKGHIRDLSTHGRGGLGVDVDDNFKPDYVIKDIQEKLVNEIKKEAKDKQVLLATDPDREGEAIAWHIADVLGLDFNLANRVIFKEITKSNVLKEINNPHKIDLDLVKSQESRRILDRIIGFKLSNLVRNKISARSAGRVQSVALKLICELEKEIQKFVPEKYYDLRIKNKLVEALFVKPNSKELVKEDLMNKVKQSVKNPYTVSDVKVKESVRKTRLPLITSTLQQEAFNKFKYSSNTTMSIAQKLYEGVEINGELTGLITYMRTDSTRLSNEFITKCNEYIKNNYGSEYVANSYNLKNKENSQDAHEAIRPANLDLTPDIVKDNLDSKEYKIYRLIYNRTVQALMTDAVNSVRTVTFTSNGYDFKAQETKNIFKGFLVLEDEKEETLSLPEYKVGDTDEFELKIEEKETQPPARYNEASLIKVLEQKGIGRPSTYSTIISTLKIRKYVDVEKKTFIPTELGMKLVDTLSEYFTKIMDVEYTSKVEKDLDDIADHKVDNIKLLRDFYDDFIIKLDEANKKIVKKEPERTGILCPLCSHELVVRSSRYGEFKACSNFPRCRYILNEKKDKEEK